MILVVMATGECCQSKVNRSILMPRRRLQSLDGCRWSLCHISPEPPQTAWLLKHSTPPSRHGKVQGLPGEPGWTWRLLGRSCSSAACPWRETGTAKRMSHRDYRNHLDLATGIFTSVISLEAAAALMWRLGCRMELLQSRARAKVPTALENTWSYWSLVLFVFIIKLHLRKCGKKAFGEVLPCHHQELVDLRVFQLIVGVPKLRLKLLLNPGVRFSWKYNKLW